MAEDGAKALEHLSRWRFDDVFMDVRMPVMEGLGALTALRGGKASCKIARTPVIGVSAYALKEGRERFLAEGMDDCVMKPVDATLLEAVLRRFIGRRKAESDA